jgi:hypothetical protein
MVNYKFVIALLLVIIVKAESAVEDFPEDDVDDNEDTLARVPITRVPNRSVHVCASAGGSAINCNLVANVPFIFDLISVSWQSNLISFYHCNNVANPQFVCTGILANPTPSPLYRSYRMRFPNGSVYHCQNFMGLNQLSCTLV